MAIIDLFGSNRKNLKLPQFNIAEEGVPNHLYDPMSAYRYMEGRRQTIIDSGRQRPLLRLWDKDMNFLGQIAQERSVSVEELMTDSGAGSCVIRRDNWLSNFILYDRRIEEDLHFTLDPIPTATDWRTRWGGKITGVQAKRSADGLHTIELEMVSNREHYKHILAAANPVFPPEVQLPKMWVLPWNCRTNLMITGFINLARQYWPLLAIPANIANPGAWLGVGVLQGLNPLSWPVQIQFCNPLFDQSRFEFLGARWTDMHTITQPLLDDAGCMVRAYTWLTEDKTSPHPELEAVIPGLQLVEEQIERIFGRWVHPPTNGTLADLARPWRNCVVLACEDKSGVTGPTGTFVDGIVNLIAATADNLITEILLPNDKNQDGETDPLFRKWFMVAPAPAWAVFRDGEYSGIVESQRIQHGASAKTVMTGGKSPGWVNQLQTFAIKYGLSQLSNVIQLIIGPTGMNLDVTGWGQPGTPGLEEIYQGQLDDTLLAWQRFTDPVRAIRMGDFGFLEHFEQGSGTAWTLSGELALREGHWKTRAYNAFKVSIRNGAPYIIGRDFDLGDRVCFEIGGVFHTDQITGVKRSYDPENYMKVELAVGNTIREQDPVSSALKTIASMWNLFGMFMGSSDLF